MDEYAGEYSDIPSNPHQDRGPLVAGVVGTFLGFIWVSMMLRFYVRRYLHGHTGWDDYVMFVASLFFTFLSGVVFWGVNKGMGRHIPDLQDVEIEKVIIAWYISEIMYCFCITLVKVSIGVFLLRIAVKKIHRYIIIFATFANIIIGIVLLTFIIFQCSPIPFFWLRVLDETDPSSGHCHNTIAPLTLIYVHSALSLLIDLTYAVLPIFMLRSLQIPKRTKFIVAWILGMGTIGSAALLIRLPFLATLGDNKDFLYNTTDVAIWSAVEPGMGIVAGSLATLRPLLLAWQGRRERRGEESRAGWWPGYFHFRLVRGDNAINESSGGGKYYHNSSPSGAVDTRSSVRTLKASERMEKWQEGIGGCRGPSPTDLELVMMYEDGRVTRMTDVELAHVAIDEEEAREERILMREIERASIVSMRSLK